MPIDNLLKIMAQLRDPTKGCPWDIVQTFETIAPYALEEAYEVVEAINNKDYENLREELGDLLLQVVFNSQIAKESNLFNFEEVIDSICVKMIKRHPHVFGNADINTSDEQLSSWEAIKAEERAKKLNKDSSSSSALDGVSVAYPALLRAEKLQKRAARVGFDWKDTEPVLRKLDEEICELKEALNNDFDQAHLEEELGDILFCCVNVARHLNLDAETALNKANRKFTKRFQFIEKSLKEELNVKPEDADFSDLENRWIRAKTINYD